PALALYLAIIIHAGPAAIEHVRINHKGTKTQSSIQFNFVTSCLCGENIGARNTPLPITVFRQTSLKSPDRHSELSECWCRCTNYVFAAPYARWNLVSVALRTSRKKFAMPHTLALRCCKCKQRKP